MADQDSTTKTTDGTGTIARKLDAAEIVVREFRRWSKNSHIALDDQFLNALSELEEQYPPPTPRTPGAEPQAGFYPRSRYGSKL